jgi:hypothetical protein
MLIHVLKYKSDSETNKQIIITNQLSHFGPRGYGEFTDEFCPRVWGIFLRLPCFVCEFPHHVPGVGVVETTD